MSYISGMRPDESSAPVGGIVLMAAVLLLAYPLSMGPAFWLCSDAMNQFHGDFKSNAFLHVYAPLLVCYQRGPQPVRRAIGDYLSLWEK